MVKLKIILNIEPIPCPFCGGRSEATKELRDGYEKFQNDPDAYAHYVCCISCAATGPWCKTSPSSAIRNWNRRIKLPKPAPPVPDGGWTNIDNVTPESIIKALGYYGNYGYGEQDAGHTWPMSLEKLRNILNLRPEDKSILSRKLAIMQKEFKKYRVCYAYYPTGWRHEPKE